MTHPIHTDPIQTLRAYAPDPADQPEQTHLLEQVFARTDLRPGARRTTRRHRLALVGAVTAAAVVGGAAAAAAGVTPHGALTWVFGPDAPHDAQHQLRLSSATKVFSVPGPHGTEFSGWTTTNEVGWECLNTFFEPAGTTRASAEAIDDSSGSCELARPEPGLFSVGSGGSNGPADDRVDFVYEADGVARAELRVSTGSVLPVTVSDGWLGGYFTLAQVPLGASATLVAYGADGTQLGSLDVQDQAGCPATTTEGC